MTLFFLISLLGINLVLSFLSFLVFVLFVGNGVHDDSIFFSFPLCFFVYFIFLHALSKDGIHPFKGLKPATRQVNSPRTEPSKTYSWL